MRRIEHLFFCIFVLFATDIERIKNIPRALGVIFHVTPREYTIESYQLQMLSVLFIVLKPRLQSEG